MAAGRPSVWSASTTCRVNGAPKRSRWPGGGAVSTFVHVMLLPYFFPNRFKLTSCVSAAFVCLMSGRTCWSCRFWRTSQPISCLRTSTWGVWWRDAPTWAGHKPVNTPQSSGRTYVELWRRLNVPMSAHTSSLDTQASASEGSFRGLWKFLQNQRWEEVIIWWSYPKTTNEKQAQNKEQKNKRELKVHISPLEKLSMTNLFKWHHQSILVLTNFKQKLCIITQRKTLYFYPTVVFDSCRLAVSY